jgi:hypothetical protein
VARVQPAWFAGVGNDFTLAVARGARAAQSITRLRSCKGRVRVRPDCLEHSFSFYNASDAAACLALIGFGPSFCACASARAARLVDIHEHLALAAVGRFQK